MIQESKAFLRAIKKLRLKIIIKSEKGCFWCFKNETTKHFRDTQVNPETLKKLLGPSTRYAYWEKSVFKSRGR
jgi:hypothetical protein